jgi:hypothetical protein
VPAAGAQHDAAALSPSATRSAAAPYFSFTDALISVCSLIVRSVCDREFLMGQ